MVYDMMTITGVAVAFAVALIVGGVILVEVRESAKKRIQKQSRKM